MPSFNASNYLKPLATPKKQTNTPAYNHPRAISHTCQRAHAHQTTTDTHTDTQTQTRTHAHARANKRTHKTNKHTNTHTHAHAQTHGREYRASASASRCFKAAAQQIAARMGESTHTNTQTSAHKHTNKQATAPPRFRCSGRARARSGLSLGSRRISCFVRLFVCLSVCLSVSFVFCLLASASPAGRGRSAS